MKHDIRGAAHSTIIDWVEPDSSVLELGCGGGELLSRLVTERSVKAQGIEIDDASIYLCVQKGLNVLQEQVDAALRDYSDKTFDFTIFDQSLQRVVRQPDVVLEEALSVSRKTIVGFSNFAHYRARYQIFFKGRTPVTASLPYEWHDTPNLHFL
ncbi:MAG: methionine biosynthesis protein MetW, partial [Actinobacteria bacterium]|nr:methionine biosynthesis protein MetW [Actinomycetota bacterium]